MAGSMKITVTPWSLVEIYHHFGGTLESSHIPEDGYLQAFIAL
jgi:hypothetical protein